MAKPMPAIFFGHGNPMNALAHNAWTDGWAAIGKDIPRPRAVLCVSAHWYLPATSVTAMPCAAHDSRLRRIPAKALRGQVPCARRPGAGAPRPGTYSRPSQSI